MRARVDAAVKGPSGMKAVPHPAALACLRRIRRSLRDTCSAQERSSWGLRADELVAMGSTIESSSRPKG